MDAQSTEIRWLWLCGLLAPPLFIATVILGGALRPGYSPLFSSVSELTAVDAPNKTLLDALFLVVYLLLALFALGLSRSARRQRRGRSSGIACAAALIVTALCCALLQVFFPQDAGGLKAVVSVIGGLHILVATAAALGGAAAILCAARWFSGQPDGRGYSRYSLATCGLMFISGGFDLLAAIIQFPLFGLIERTTIGAFVLWVFLTALRLTAWRIPAFSAGRRARSP